MLKNVAIWINIEIWGCLNIRSYDLNEDGWVSVLKVWFFNGESVIGLLGYSFGWDSLLGLVSFSLLFIVVSDSVEEALSWSWFLDVLNSNMNSLGDDSVSDLLVDDDSYWSRIDIEDSSCSSVIVSVWHTLVDGSVDSDINDVSNSVGSESLSNVDSSNLSESLLE